MEPLGSAKREISKKKYIYIERGLRQTNKDLKACNWEDKHRRRRQPGGGN